MRLRRVVLAVIVAGFAWSLMIAGAKAEPQALLEPGVSLGLEGAAGASNSADSGLYSLGTIAINESRWADAVTLFTKVAAEHGDHAAGALYWKAYAENRQGQSALALESCNQLRQAYAGSSWIDDCGALEIEIHARTGKPVQPQTEQSDELKLLALNSLMQKNESKARAQIEEILNGDSSERLKEGALFILGRSAEDTTYPQIVRVSHVEGDVRIARGEKGAMWEKADSNLPLETGFTLATGDGRAEIELENASTLYLGENSVLALNDLHTTSGVPHSEVALLTGTMTMHLNTLMPGEWFLLRTPADSLLTRYPQKVEMRITSYTDAVGFTSLRGGFLNLSGGAVQPLTDGQTLYYRDGRRLDSPGTGAGTDFAAWDKWVQDRYEKRTAAASAVMKDAGLTAPIPGLAEMKDKGSFFDCAPYGTCWEAAQIWLPETAVSATPQSGQAQPSGQSQRPRALDPNTRLDYDLFPCMPESLRYRQSQYNYSNPLPYEWAVCHTGSWIYRNHRYAWVVGHKRHHHDPVHWVKNGHTVAYVPIHPRDVKGQPPVNREHGFVPVHDGKTTSIKLADLDATRPVDVLKSPPKEFRNASVAPLARAEDPHIQAHSLKGEVTGKGPAERSVGIPLTFDHKTQSFMMPTHIMQGNKSVTTMAPINNRSGNLQARGGSFGGGGAGAGGSHGGGGGSSSGGSHGGGGGSGGSSGSISVSSTGGGSSAGSSSGGSHH